MLKIKNDDVDMNNTETYNSIFSEFGDQEIALNATILISINKSLTPSNEEMTTKGLYTKRLLKMFDSVLFELSEEKKNLCLKIWEATHSYEIAKSFNGLGGCVEKTYKELIV